MFSRKSSQLQDTLPSYVRDIGTANCVFCPYGADVTAGDRLYIYDEKTLFGRQQRERLVEVQSVKAFHSTGRVISLDASMISAEEAAHIAADSEMSLESLLGHHAGNSTYDKKRPPVVVYFKPCDEDDTIGAQYRPRYKRAPGWRRLLNRIWPWSSRTLAR